jgi:Na+/proline symporter
MKPATSIACIIFILVALAHLLRLIFKVEVTIDGIVMPIWISIVGAIIPVLLAIMIWRENKRQLKKRHEVLR